METPTSFGLWLQARRQALGLTQQELADHVHCSRSLIRKIEADERRPSQEIAELLAEHLQIRAEARTLFFKVARQELRIEQLAQVMAPPVHPLPVEALPTRNQAAQTRRSGLPLPTTTLVGRTTKLAMLSQLLHDPACRLLTLVGLGGISKTRLALAAAAHAQALFPDGVYFVSLAAISDGQLLLPTLAGALDLPLQAAGEAKQQLLNHLHNRCLLLVLDSVMIGRT
ncbi:MAG: helix-turn-helix domain-containing protein [Caldilineaceae bacterium]